MIARRRVPWQIQFTACVLIWGLSFLFIKISLEGLVPVQVALARTGLGALTLLAVLFVRREPLPRDLRLWAHLAVAGTLLAAAPFTLLAYGEQLVPSLLAGIWNATTPLLTLVVVMVTLPNERPTRARVAGLTIGFIGVLVVLGVWRGLNGGALTGSLLCLAAAACYGLGIPYNRRFLAGRPESVLTVTTGQLLIATVVLAVIAPLVSTAPDHLSGRVITSVLTLGVVGTGIAYVLNNAVIRAAGATTSATVTYFIPLVSTLAGVFFLGEQLSWNEPVGAIIVLAGIVLSQDWLRRPQP